MEDSLVCYYDVLYKRTLSSFKIAAVSVTAVRQQVHILYVVMLDTFEEQF